MKKTFLLFASVIILSSGCRPIGTWIRITNPLDLERKEEKIILTAEQVAGWREIPFGLYPLLIEADGTPIPTQSDDFDEDGKWDEIIALINIGPDEKKFVQLVFRGESIYPDFKDRTNVRLGANAKGYPELTKADRLEGVTYHNHSLTGDAFQMEGPAWENDHVGFRNYLDQRNGMDIFGKLTSEMVLDSVGISGRVSYHKPDDWGMDILKVGTSLGSGSIGYYYNDSIFRVGDNGKGTYELVVDGDLRSILRFSFNQWQMGDQLLDVIHNIEIQAGSYFYESSVSCSGAGRSPELVTGIVNIQSDELHIEKLNDQYAALYTHDIQTEDTSLLGMALMVPSNLLVANGATKDSGEGITQTYFVRLKTEPEKPVKFRFYSFWEKENQEWSDPAAYIKVMKQDADQMSNPLIIELESNYIPE